MALFITSKKKADGRKGESDETQNLNSYKFKLNVLENKYKDAFGNVTSPKFYDEWNEILEEAYDGPLTSGNIITLQNASQTLNSQKANFEFSDTMKTGETGITTAREDLEDTWGNVWQNKQALAAGNFEGMMATMEGYILQEKTQLQEELKNLKSITDDSDMISGVESVIEFYDEQEAMYRDALMSPSRFRLDVNSNDAGEITDVRLNPMNANDEGYSYTSKDSPNGMKIFAKSNKGLGKDDEQRTAIGSSLFKKFANGDDFEASDDDLDFTSWRVQDPRNSRTGDVLVGPSGKVLMKNEDGSYEKSNSYGVNGPNRRIDKILGVPVANPNQYRVSQDLFDSIERTQPVDDVVKREMENSRMSQTQNELEGYIKPYNSNAVEDRVKGASPDFLSLANVQKTTQNKKSAQKKETGGFLNTAGKIFGGLFSGGSSSQRYNPFGKK